MFCLEYTAQVMLSFVKISIGFANPLETYSALPTYGAKLHVKTGPQTKQY